MIRPKYPQYPWPPFPGPTTCYANELQYITRIITPSPLSARFSARHATVNGTRLRCSEDGRIFSALYCYCCWLASFYLRSIYHCHWFVCALATTGSLSLSLCLLPMLRSDFDIPCFLSFGLSSDRVASFIDGRFDGDYGRARGKLRRLVE